MTNILDDARAEELRQMLSEDMPARELVQLLNELIEVTGYKGVVKAVEYEWYMKWSGEGDGD